MKKNALWTALLLLLGGSAFVACSDDDEPLKGPDSAVSSEIYNANIFGRETMEVYYYWTKEVSAGLAAWDAATTQDPIAYVSDLRYREGDTEVDKWTTLTDDFDSMSGSMEGVSTTFGWELTVYRLNENSEQCVAAVRVVYPDSPAAAAGLKRGDILISMNGADITTNNYSDLVYAPSLNVGLGYYDGETNTVYITDKSVDLTAVEMYTDPVLCDSIYEFNGKKVGYLAYNSFDLRSIDRLVEIGREFKAEGVKELVLDLRYNGGGYVITENVLASMFAPAENVTAGDVFEREAYNELLTEVLGDGASYLTTEFYYPEYGVNANTTDANIGLERIYGLMTGNTASASEALLGGLMPYMDVRLIGENSYGKYCTGYLISPENFYQNPPRDIENWGIYVMVAIYQNSVGETPCMPNGMVPDVAVSDNPLLPYQLGDVNEPMLRAALEDAGRVYDDEAPQTRSAQVIYQQMPPLHTPVFGKRILQPQQLPLRPFGK